MKIVKVLLSILIALIILSFPIDYLRQSPLVREIAQLEAPVRFLDEVRFDALAEKYIPLGIEKEQAIRQLESYGFNIIRSDTVPRLLKCEQCDKEYVFASEWVRQNPKGRQAKSKARLARFNELSEHEYQKRNETQEIFIPVAERLGNEVIEFKNVSKAFGDRLLIDNLSFKIPPGAIVGIIGPNGAGKSTLFKLITGKEQPDSGEVVIGSTARVSIVDQSRDSLNDSKTVFDDVTAGADILTVGRFEMASRAYLGRFNFKGGDQQKIVGNLSGGERGRLHLAKTLLQGGNVLLLDEPSNDLDVETLRALEDALLEFAGSVMVISHDRWFLDRIATHILAFEGNSQVSFFDGNYQEYEADKRKRLGEEGAKPKRIRYKPLTT